MSYYRSYFEKNNTIIKNSRVNTSKSPTTDIFYGNSFSRFIFKVDLAGLKKNIEDGELVVNEDTKHYLHLTNTVFGDSSLVGDLRLTGKLRATSFDLILFEIPEFWDEGVGFESEINVNAITQGNSTYNEQPSNWFNRTILNNWSQEGVEVTEDMIIRKIHFDNGNENIHADITSYINEVLSGEKNYHGMGLCFEFVYENLNLKTDKSVSFFTKYTQTFFEPYMESVFSDTIIDNRHDFVEKIDQNLYLTVNDRNKYIDLDENPVVDIVDNTGNIVIPNNPTDRIRKGVYRTKIKIEDNVVNNRIFYNDVWKNIKLGGVDLENITQKFLPKTVNNGVIFNSEIEKTPKLVFRSVGISQSEKIKSGDKRKISLKFKSIDNSKTSYKDVFYRLFIWEGRTSVNVIDWTLMDYQNENSFILDTSILIPREYSLEIKVFNGNEVHTMNDIINFEIISER